MNGVKREIRGESRTVRQLLDGEKYTIDYYQREYKWQSKQVQELISDLALKFLQDYQETHDRQMVEYYGHYFLGSIIVSNREGKQYVIDGQQRMTTLTLLFIYLNHLAKDRMDETPPVQNLIFSSKFAKKSFNLDVPEREACMEALFKGDETFDPYSARSPAVLNIWNRYQDIRDFFPEELTAEAFPYFMDWLLDLVHIVKITAYSDADAYTVFETMNDRGLSLTPTEMLKGYLLSKISGENERIAMNTLWKEHIAILSSIAKEHDIKELDADCIKTWLRSQYSRNIRPRKPGATPEDWDRIGTEFHRWVRENTKLLDLAKSSDYIRFIEKDFDFYSRQYQALILASSTLTPEYEHVYYNAQNRFTLQYQALLSPILRTDSPEIIRRKFRAVAKYLDILIARRMMNFSAIDYSAMQYAMFALMRDIRGLSLEELVDTLTSKLQEEVEVIGTRKDYQLTKSNGPKMHYLLARITDYVDRMSGQPSRYLEYTTGRGKQKYEIEHIWANHYDQHRDEFPQSYDFAVTRDRFGGLLIVPKSFNAAFGDSTYEEKLPHYLKQNLLAQSLHQQGYKKNPGFSQWIKDQNLPFAPIEKFTRASIEARGDLYFQIANLVWSPDILKEELVV